MSLFGDYLYLDVETSENNMNEFVIDGSTYTRDEMKSMVEIMDFLELFFADYKSDKIFDHPMWRQINYRPRIWILDRIERDVVREYCGVCKMIEIIIPELEDMLKSMLDEIYGSYIDPFEQFGASFYTQEEHLNYEVRSRECGNMKKWLQTKLDQEGNENVQ